MCVPSNFSCCFLRSFIFRWGGGSSFFLGLWWAALIEGFWEAICTSLWLFLPFPLWIYLSLDLSHLNFHLFNSWRLISTSKVLISSKAAQKTGSRENLKAMLGLTGLASCPRAHSLTQPDTDAIKSDVSCVLFSIFFSKRRQIWHLWFIKTEA